MKNLIKILTLTLASSILLVSCTTNTDTESTTEAVVDATTEATTETGETDETTVDNRTPEEITADQAIEILENHSTKNLTYAPLHDPDDAYNLNIVKNVHMVEVITGEYSINETKTNYSIGGTDLGITFNDENQTYIAFGDTFANEGMHGIWRSNVMAVTTDTDYTDGILFDSMISMPNRTLAKELIPSRKVDKIEMTTIPTGGIALDGALYLSFMSVNHWGPPGEWDLNYGGIAKSVDEGQNWEILEDLQWPGDSHFGQMAPVQHEDYIYVFGITGGRKDPLKLMRVPVAEYENFDAYEYFMGRDDEGNAIYAQGEENIYDAANLIDGAVGEMSVIYSEYLEEWIITYMDGKADMVIASSPNIDGPYSNPVILVAQSDFPGLYGAFMNPLWVSDDGTKIGFLLSLWDPVYNVVMMEMELER